MQENIVTALKPIEPAAARGLFGGDGSIPGTSSTGKLRVRATKDKRLKWLAAASITKTAQAHVTDSCPHQVCQLLAWCGEAIEVPHLKVTLSKNSEGTVSFCADLIPRCKTVPMTCSVYTALSRCALWARTRRAALILVCAYSCWLCVAESRG